jgi:hypothetical protein
MALSPERLLLTALDSPDLHSLPNVVLQDVPQNVVSFTLDGASASVHLNAYTHTFQRRLTTPARWRMAISGTTWGTSP